MDKAVTITIIIAICLIVFWFMGKVSKGVGGFDFGLNKNSMNDKANDDAESMKESIQQNNTAMQQNSMTVASEETGAERLSQSEHRNWRI